VEEERVQRIILYGMRDHLIPYLVEKKKTKEMWDTLKALYDIKKENMKMALRGISSELGWPRERVWHLISPILGR
jgi:hypothetical protein